MQKLSSIPTIVLLCLLALVAQPILAQNTVLTTSTALPGGGSGTGNVAVGPGNSYPSADNVIESVFIGGAAGIAITSGYHNSFVGFQAGGSNTTGVFNSFMGHRAGYGNTSGSYNSFMGVSSGSGNIIGSNNSFMGYTAGYNNAGSGNSFVGSSAGYVNSSGSYNTFMGNQAGYNNTTGSQNSFTGSGAGYVNTTGENNSFMGSLAGRSNTSGSNNSFMGYQAGYSQSTGGNNSFMGSFAGRSNTSGSNNSFTGYEAGYQNTTGYNNAFMGFRAGYLNTKGAFNSFIGTFADALEPNKPDVQRATALGYNAKVAVDDGLVLGDTTNVKVGIGTAYPTQRFTLRGNINFVAYDNSLMLKNQPFLHFNGHESLALGLGSEIAPGAEKTIVLGSKQGTVQIPGIVNSYLPNSGQVLTVNEQGKLLLIQPRIQVASAADWSDKVFEQGYALRPLGEVEEFVKKNKHLPGVPSAEAMVAEGMESAALNAKLLEKIEELTLYMVALEKRLKELEKK